MPQIRYRIGRVADLPRILEIRLNSPVMRLTREELCARGFTIEGAADRLHADWKFFVIEIDRVVQGFCLADRCRETIEAWFLDGSVAGRGVGQPLFSIALQWLWVNGATRIRLVTEPRTRIYRWYKEHGWKVVGAKPNGYVELELSRSRAAAFPGSRPAARPQCGMPLLSSAALALRAASLIAAVASCRALRIFDFRRGPS